MKRYFSVLTILVFSGLVAGCPLGGNSKEVAMLKNEITSLKNSMGAFQYMGVNPELSFSIQKADFEAPSDEYSEPRVNYTINIKQHNQSFKPSEYFVNATLGIVDSSGNELTQVSIGGKMENGVLSLSDDAQLFGLDGKVSSKDISKLHLKVDFYSWFPDNHLKPYKPTSMH